MPPPTDGEVRTPEATTPTSPQATPTPAGQGSGAPAATGSLRLSTPSVDRRRLAKGRVTVRWKVLEAGPGIRRWTISSLAIGRRHARWVNRASGAQETAATIRLPKGAAYRLRFVVTDAAGGTSTVALGKVKVPRGKLRHRR